MIGLIAMLAASSLSTGNDLYAKCKSDSMFDSGLCYGFVSGVISGVQTEKAIAQRPQIWCSRDSVTNGQIIAVVIKFMDDNPSIRDQDAAAIVLYAMMNGFPCSAAKPKP